MVGDRLGRVGLLFALLALPGSLACTRASLAPAPSSTHADPPAAKHVGRSQPPPTEPGLRILGEGGRALAGASVCVLSGPERELLRCRAADDAGIVEDEGGSLDADLRLVISVADHCGREV